MSKKLLTIIIFFILISLLFPTNLGVADEIKPAADEWTLEKYIKYFYNRYSTHFDKSGLRYMAPDYGIEDWKAPKTAREYISLAMYYKSRAQEGDYIAKNILRKAVFNAQRELTLRPYNTQSFEDAEAHFLILRTLDSSQDLFLEKEKNKILDWMEKYVEYGIQAPDTENRALISAAHWQYIVDYLSSKGKINISDLKKYNKMIKDKIDLVIMTNITKKGWYIEGQFNNFTPHYHAVSAYMLMIYSKLTGYKQYEELAAKMYKNLKSVSFENGMVEARLGHRPIGLGAQFYLITGMLGKAFNDKDYSTYLFYGAGQRFFSDRAYPNRLEYHSTIEGSLPQFHDDYSFSDAAELSLIIPSLKEGEFTFTHKIIIPPIIKEARFVQKNTGREIIFNRHKIMLGSYGNWTIIDHRKRYK